MLHGIFTKATADAVIPVLASAGYTVETYTYTIAAAGQGGAALNELDRLPVDTLLLDVNTGPNLAPVLIGYLLRRSETTPRIRVILLAQGIEPGNVDVASLAAAQIYDVVTDLTTVPVVLSRPPADWRSATRWINPRLDPSFAARPTEPAEIVYREKLIGTTVIAIAGAGRGVGVTSTALLMAQFLAEYGSVGVVELTPYPTFYSLSVARFSRPNIHLYPQTSQRALYVASLTNFMDLPQLRSHTYIIIDLGQYWHVSSSAPSQIAYHPYRQEMARADIPILMAGSCPWQLLDMQPFMLPETQGFLPDWHLFLREPADRSFARDISQDFRSVSFIPHTGSLNVVPEEIKGTFTKILRPILPKSGAKERRLWPWGR